MSSLTEPQKAPQNVGAPIVPLVIADLEARREFGRKKYGDELRLSMTEMVFGKGVFPGEDHVLTLSYRQPWAWMIVHGWKDIENRSWSTRVRGRTLVHAAKGMTRDEYDDAVSVAVNILGGRAWHEIPAFEAIERGGIVGSVEIVDCVTASESEWFFGPYGFLLSASQVLPFLPLRGQLNFFEVAA